MVMDLLKHTYAQLQVGGAVAILKIMSRVSRLSNADLIEIKRLYSEGAKRDVISKILLERGIVMSPATIYYHLGLRKAKKKGVKSYLDYVREDCERRGVPFRNPRPKGLWS